MTPPTDIDEHERERVRLALERYMKLHRLGAVRLTKLIEETLKLRVGQSTLQRFLRGGRRTEDIAVHRFRLFLRRAAPPPSGDELARAFKAFLPVDSFPKGGLRPLAGNYRSFRRPYAAAPAPVNPLAARLFARNRIITAPAIMGQGFTPDVAGLTLSRGMEPGYLRVSEAFDDTQAEADRNPEPEDTWLSSSGVLLPCGADQFIIMMRGYLEGRFYLVRLISWMPVVFRGFVFEQESMQQIAAALSDMKAWQPRFEVMLMRKTQNDKT